MKSASAAVIDLLESRQWVQADLFAFQFVGGGSAAYTNFDQDISAGAYNFLCGGVTGPYIDRSSRRARVNWKKGLEVSTLTFDVIPGSATLFGNTFLNCVRLGLFDGADLSMSRAYGYMNGLTFVVAGTVSMFVGRVAEVSASRSVATFTVNSHVELLNQDIPRNVYTPGCVNSLGDPACGVNLTPLAHNGTVITASVWEIEAPNPSISQYWEQGKVLMTSGALSGLSRTIVRWGSHIELLNPFPSAPSPFDTFTTYPGCDKTFGSNGCAKFSNTARYRGFPFIPVPETAV